ncbi:MAG: hypothetical protein ABJL72_16550 [Roseobacter sp.]
MPKPMAFVDKGVRADTLALAEIFERLAGMQTFAAYFELLTIAGSVQSFTFLPELWQIQALHQLQDFVIGCADVLEGKSPIYHVFELALCDKGRDTRHFSHPDPAT